MDSPVVQGQVDGNLGQAVVGQGWICRVPVLAGVVKDGFGHAKEEETLNEDQN